MDRRAPNPWIDLFQHLDPVLADLVAEHFTDSRRYATPPELEDVKQLVRFVTGHGSAIEYENHMRQRSNSAMSRRRRAFRNDGRHTELFTFLDNRASIITRLIVDEFISAGLAIQLLHRNAVG